MNWDENLLLVCTPVSGSYVTGTAFLVASDLCLTARHVVRPGKRKTRGPIQCRFDGAAEWSDGEVVWEHEELDAALVRLAGTGRRSAQVLTEAVAAPLTEWTGKGYARANTETLPDARQVWPAMSLQGNVHTAHEDHQDLSVQGAPDEDDGWAGCSGAPVVCDGKVVAMIVQARAKERLRAVPMQRLLADSEFRLAIGWDDDRHGRWVEEVQADVQAALARSKPACEELVKSLVESGLERARSGASTDAGHLAETLLARVALEVAITAVDRAHVRLHRRGQRKDARALRDVLDRVMPVVFDRGVTLGTRRQFETGAALISIPVATVTLAELAMAATDERPARFRDPMGGDDPQGEALVTSPAVVETGLRDRESGLVDTLIEDLKEWLQLRETGRELEQRIRDETEWLARSSNLERLPLYLIVARPAEVSEWGVAVLAEIRERFPHVRVLGLTSRETSPELKGVGLPLRSIYLRDANKRKP